MSADALAAATTARQPLQGPRVGLPPHSGGMPRGTRFSIDGATRRFGMGGRVLVGGMPRRVMRLSESGARVVGDLVGAGAPSAVAAALARTLTDAGLLHPRVEGLRRAERADPPSDAPHGEDLTRGDDRPTVVIPVRDRVVALERCLHAMGGRLPVVVVDDGSVDAAAVARVADLHGALLIRRDRPGGPGVARNAGIAAVGSSLVVLLDSDCVAEPDALIRLLPHFDDAQVAAVAPRIRASRRGSSWIGRYAAGRSPIDMGPAPQLVRAGGPVPYVPTAALVVRRSAIGDGFDPGLRYGEDVDLVWRLGDAGWRVRYEPAVVVAHDEPERWSSLLVRRYCYGTSAGPLARKHGQRLAPVVLRPWPTAAALLLLVRRPVPAAAAAAIVGAQGAMLGRRLRRTGVPQRLGPLWTARAVVETLDGIARATTMFAGPAAAVAIVRGRRPGRSVAVLLAGSALRSWWRSDRTLDPVRWVAAATADDVAYGAGVWVGAVRSRAVRALLPAFGATGG